MSPLSPGRRAIVFGGSGVVGREVVRALRRAGADVTFTFHTQSELACGLADETGALAIQADLRQLAQLEEVIGGRDSAGALPDVMVYCAAITRAGPIDSATGDDWDEVFAVNCRAAHQAARLLSQRWMQRSVSGDIVLLGALDARQSLPLPSIFAASQGALGAMVMALAKELGPHGIKTNLLSLGVLGSGLSKDLSGETLEDFETFSALRRRGTPEEVARAIAWLSLNNTYLNGKTVPINGGI